MRKVKIYKRPSNATNYELQLIAEYQVKKVFEDSFYHRPIETLSAKRCREVLNKLYPTSKVNSELVIFEWVDSGYKWGQKIYRTGTILIG